MKHFIGLDVGNVRIGVAIASVEARIARPYTTLSNNQAIFETINEIITDNDVIGVVVGLPRGMDGQMTAQTRAAVTFAESLKSAIAVPVHMQDETLTSKAAEAELEARKQPYRKEAIDALAATYILKDYLEEYPNAGKE